MESLTVVSYSDDQFPVTSDCLLDQLEKTELCEKIISKLKQVNSEPATNTEESEPMQVISEYNDHTTKPFNTTLYSKLISLDSPDLNVDSESSNLTTHATILTDDPKLEILQKTLCTNGGIAEKMASEPKTYASILDTDIEEEGRYSCLSNTNSPVACQTSCSTELENRSSARTQVLKLWPDMKIKDNEVTEKQKIKCKVIPIKKSKVGEQKPKMFELKEEHQLKEAIHEIPSQTVSDIVPDCMAADMMLATKNMVVNDVSEQFRLLEPAQLLMLRSDLPPVEEEGIMPDILMSAIDVISDDIKTDLRCNGTSVLTIPSSTTQEHCLSASDDHQHLSRILNSTEVRFSYLTKMGEAKMPWMNMFPNTKVTREEDTSEAIDFPLSLQSASEVLNQSIPQLSMDSLAISSSFVETYQSSLYPENCSACKTEDSSSLIIDDDTQSWFCNKNCPDSDDLCALDGHIDETPMLFNNHDHSYLSTAMKSKNMNQKESRLARKRQIQDCDKNNVDLSGPALDCLIESIEEILLPPSEKSDNVTDAGIIFPIHMQVAEKELKKKVKRHKRESIETNGKKMRKMKGERGIMELQEITKDSIEKGLQTENVEAPKLYSYNCLSSLNFLVQNVLDNVFKYDNYPSSSNMSRLAKIMNVSWRDVRDWFAARRLHRKQCGLSVRKQSLIRCSYCPSLTFLPADEPMVHLLDPSHVHNMMKILSIEYPHMTEECLSEEYSARIECYKVQHKYSQVKTNVHLKLGSSKLSHECNTSLIDSKRALLGGEEREKVVSGILKTTLLSEYHTSEKVIQDQLSPTEVRSSRVEKEREKVVSAAQKEVPVLEYPTFEKNMILEHLSSTEDNSPLRNYSQLCDTWIGYRCPMCETIFANEWMLLKHSLVHRNFICNQCNEEFEKEHLLHQHLKEHLIHEIKPEFHSFFTCFECKSLDCICPKSPKVKCKGVIPFSKVLHSGLNDNLRITTKELFAQFKKDFAPIQQRSMKNYEGAAQKLGQNYTNVVTYNCTHCEAFYFTNNELETHMSLHLGTAKNLHLTRKPLSRNPNLKIIQQKKSTFCAYCHICCDAIPDFKEHLLSQCKGVDMKEMNGLYLSKATYTCSVAPVNCRNCMCKVNKSKLHVHRMHCIFKQNSKVEPRRSNCKKQTQKTLRSQVLPSLCLENKYIYICKSCCISFSSVEMFLGHRKRKCHTVGIPKERVVASIHISKLESYYDHDNLRQLLEFRNSSQIGKVICKFCSKPQLESELLGHLLDNCRKIPKEILLVLQSKKVLVKSILGTIMSLKKQTVLATGNPKKLGCKPEPLASSLYECHLCDAHFPLTEDIIGHLHYAHNLRIPRESAQKWLTEKFIDQGSDLDNIVENMLITDNILVEDEKVDQSTDETRTLKKSDIFSPPKRCIDDIAQSNDDSCLLLQDEDGGDLLEDYDNLDSIVETEELQL